MSLPFPISASIFVFRVFPYIYDCFSLIAANRSFIGLTRMETSGRKEAPEPWNSWSTKLLVKLGFLWGNPRHSRSAPIISVRVRFRLSIVASASSISDFDFENFIASWSLQFYLLWMCKNMLAMRNLAFGMLGILLMVNSRMNCSVFVFLPLKVSTHFQVVFCRWFCLHTAILIGVFTVRLI